MKIIITGGNGYIGSRLVNAYKHDGAMVYSWTRQGIVGPDYNEPLFLLNEKDVQKALNDIHPDKIINCAGAPDVWKSIDEPFYDLEGNYIITHNLLHLMKKLELNKCRFVVLSSAAVYGNPISLPITEDEPVKPLTPYALHKHFSELLCLYMNNNYGLDTKVVRIFSAFGPGIRKQILWDMYNKVNKYGYIELFGDGSDSRDYIFIDDAVSAIKLVADKALKDDIYFNIANGEEITIKTVAEIFCQKYGLTSDVLKFSGNARAGDPANWKADVSKIISLGYKKTVEFDEGIERYVNWLHQLT